MSPRKLLITSNKTLKASSKKGTASARKFWRPVASFAVLIVLLVVWSGIAQAPAKVTTIHGHTLSVEYADTPAEQVKGLGGRPRLPDDHAMVFRFGSPAQRCFWMKDMRFSLDIIWISVDKKVIHIEPNVSPATYPHKFCPAEWAQYVIEVNAGTSYQLGLKNGDTISF